MSFIRFQDPSGCATLPGHPRLHLLGLVHESVADTLARGRVPGHIGTRLYGLLPGTSRLRQQPAPDPSGRGIGGWLTDYTRELHSGSGRPVLEYRGRLLSTWPLLLNSAIARGGDPVRLAARLHGQCEINCWVDGAHRSWLAGIVEVGLLTEAYPPGVGWENVAAFLRQRDDHPVVVSYNREFPHFWDCGYAEDPDQDPDRAVQAWRVLSPQQRWEAGTRALSTRAAEVLEISPARWTSYRFGHGLCVGDLLASDWEQRLDRALGLQSAH
ncbi:hypothetical protein KAURM247S_05629 [Kitasatospora aureofaciens]